MTKLSLITTVALVPAVVTAFAPIAPTANQIATKPAFVAQGPLFAETEDKAVEAAFVPVDAAPEEGDDEVFAKAESLGKGSAKVRNFISKLFDCSYFYVHTIPTLQ